MLWWDWSCVDGENERIYASSSLRRIKFVQIRTRAFWDFVGKNVSTNPKSGEQTHFASPTASARSARAGSSSTLCMLWITCCGLETTRRVSRKIFAFNVAQRRFNQEQSLHERRSQKPGMCRVRRSFLINFLNESKTSSQDWTLRASYKPATRTPLPQSIDEKHGNTTQSLFWRT